MVLFFGSICAKWRSPGLQAIFLKKYPKTFLHQIKNGYLRLLRFGLRRGAKNPHPGQLWLSD